MAFCVHYSNHKWEKTGMYEFRVRWLGPLADSNIVPAVLGPLEQSRGNVWTRLEDLHETTNRNDKSDPTRR